MWKWIKLVGKKQPIEVYDKWAHERINQHFNYHLELVAEIKILQNEVKSLKLTKQNKPQNRKPPIRKAAVRRGK